MLELRIILFLLLLLLISLFLSIRNLLLFLLSLPIL